ncbi:putative HTH_8 domain-containing protein [Vibrio chagasii]|nr:putative HTH_8 domain-containing protein [Vibrio chagasii]
MTDHSSKVINQKEIRAILSKTISPSPTRHQNFVDASVVLKAVKEIVIQEALIHTRGNQTAAARILGISRSTLTLHLKNKANNKG